MKHLPLFISALAVSSAFAYTVSGKVTDEDGQAIKGAAVTLVKENKNATTDEAGKYTIHEDEAEIPPIGIQASAVKPGYISINSGILSYSQSGNAPVQVRIFDAVGHQVLNQTLYGAGEVDLRTGTNAMGSYYAQVTMGSAKQNIRFTTNGSYATSFDAQGHALLKEIQQGETLQFVAEGFDTLSVPLGTLDTTVNVQLKKTVPPAPTYKFGYALKNDPTPSKGCGVDSKLQSTGQNSNAKKYGMTSAGLNREFWITLPKNYDKTKPYKILFAMHCMGSNAEDFTNHTPDQDHPSPYYGQQNLDKDNNYIFVAPRGDTDFMPWRTGDDKDHIFFGELLTLLEENYCIDTSRVFVTGFSFGAMVTNSLAQDFQDRIRAVAVYATADYNIYLPTNKGKPIAWMAVHGKNDGTCDYNRAKNSAVKRILKNNGKADADGNFSDASAETPKEVGGSGHLCYDFTTVDERFPVKFCSWNGPHQWTAYDNGNWQNTWVPEEVHKFFEQF
ncbi:MAG: carboxypeptidase regulatory-like domain-containing protein [Fibrobacter sp.]|uniref:carboxypeptidase regulatory-like domain-containing protein n=1 Tax=Fibrobacter sp. TaxID=35828 RepID=UPI0025BCC951|nr:carboxypeptidase regulatory-like domain-containing protein [Fibrobacter sp.]MBR4786130.1 carboxypeptidase regulatory-like domain-containing protein [Fibrobacter sp.]